VTPARADSVQACQKSPRGVAANEDVFFWRAEERVSCHALILSRLIIEGAKGGAIAAAAIDKTADGDNGCARAVRRDLATRPEIGVVAKPPPRGYIL